jgi:rare lipoprotein A
VTKTGILLTAGLLWGFGLTAGARAHSVEQFSGIASFYGDDYRGKTANGEQYDPAQFTAAHPTLPFGTLLRVSDPCNERSVTVVITDRGPFVDGRVLDLSKAAAEALGMVDRGILVVTAVVAHIRPIRLRALFAGRTFTP